MNPNSNFIVDRLSNPYDLAVYIAQSKLSALQINEGDVVKISTRTKNIIAYVRAAKRASFPISNIQMNRCLRQNLGTYLGQIVTVTAYKGCQPADKILLNPIEDTIKGITDNFFELIRSSDYDFFELPIQPEMIIPIYALGHVFEFKVKTVHPQPAVLTNNVNQVQVNNQPVRRQKSKPFDCPCYDDIGGMKKVIKEIRKSIELPLLQPAIFQLFGITPHKGILFVAPHGCGKTFLSQCIRNETPVHYEHIPCLDIIARPPELTLTIFRRFCERAISKAPSIVYIDDIDLIARDQKLSNNQVDQRLKYTVLANIDRLLQEKQIVVIATATSADNITPELLGNRLMHQITITKPNKKERVDIVTKLTRKYTVAEKTSPEDLVELYNASTGSELQSHIQRIVTLKTLRSLEKIVNHNGPVQIDDLKTVIIERMRFDELLKNYIQTNDGCHNMVHQNQNNFANQNNNAFPSNAIPFAPPQNQSNNPANNNVFAFPPSQASPNQNQQMFFNSNTADPFAQYGNTSSSGPTSTTINTDPFNTQTEHQPIPQQPPPQVMPQAVTAPEIHDPFAKKPTQTPLDPFSTPPPQQMQPVAQQMPQQPIQPPPQQAPPLEQPDLNGKGKGKKDGKKTKKEKTNPFSIKKK